MKDSKKLDNDADIFQCVVAASLQDGPQEYTAVCTSQGKLVAWGLKNASEWIWVHKNFQK